MRLAVFAVIALFVGLLVVVWVSSERARPQFIDVDPAAVHNQHKHP